MKTVMMEKTCADPESFVRRGPLLIDVIFFIIFFSLMRGGRINFAGVPMMTHH